MQKYTVVVGSIETNHRNPSKHDPDERYRYGNWLKQNKKLYKEESSKPERVE